MSIELNRDLIAHQVKTAIRRQIAIWHGSKLDISDRLGELITEAMIEVAASVKSGHATTEGAIHRGLAMIKNWRD